MKAPSTLTADVTKSVEPHTMGDDHARPGIVAIHATFFVSDQRIGGVAVSETPELPGPRNCGQFSAEAMEDESGSNEIQR